MAPKSVCVFAFLLILAFYNIPIRGGDLANQSDPITNAQGQNSSASVRPLAETVQQNKFVAGYYSSNQYWHGVRARINIWAIPDVMPKSYSSAYIAASTNGEKIAAGVHVYPGLYRNNDLRFFTYWTTNDGWSTGCYNRQCDGFIVANGTNLYPGQALAPPFSTYGGEQKYITLRIKKDEKTGDWSLYREDQGGPIGGMTLLGWWPKTLFSALSDHATKIEWTGAISYAFSEKSPLMGSGHHAEEYEGKAAFFQNIIAFTKNGKQYDPNGEDVFANMDKYYCYDVSAWFKGKENGFHFFYGGPKGCTWMKL